MRTSENGVAFIESNEGFASIPYEDNGKLAWGFGHDQQPGETLLEPLTRAQAESILRDDLSTRFEPAVSALVPSDCTQSQFDALVDFAYNLGVESLKTMLSHGWDQVPVQMLRWDNVNGKPNAGLAARRQKEVVLFQLP